MRKNVASQVVAFQMNSATDGSAVTTGTPTVYYTVDGGTQGTGAGTSAHEGNGQWSYAPAQAETNGDHVAFTMVLTSAISQTVNVWPVSFDPTDSVRAGLTALPNAAADAAGGLPISDAGGLDMDGIKAKTDSLTFTVANQVDANAVAISGDTTAADNLELQYDTTGLTGDTFPATQSQLGALTVTGAAVNVAATASPNGFTLTTGSEVNTEDSTQALDGTYHELSDSAGTLDGYYKFALGGDGLPTSVTIKAVAQSSNDTFGIYVNTGSSGTPTWSQRGTITGSGSSLVTSYTFDLFSDDIVTDVTGGVWVRIYGTGLSSSSFDVDQIFISKAVVNRSVGYEGGKVWIDTASGTAGTESYINGVADNPVDTLADAKTIASNIGLDKYNVSNDSSITLAGSTVNEEIYGTGWTLALGGQDVSNSHFIGANSVTGTSTSPTGETHFIECEMGTASVGNSHFKQCGFDGTLTGVAATDYFIVDGYSQVAGSGSPTFTFTGNGASSTINVRNWRGGGTWNFDANCTASVEVSKGGTHTIAVGGGDVEFRGFCKAVSLTGVAATSTVNIMAMTGPITINGTGGTVNVYGQHSGITDSSGGSVTINDNSVDGPAVGTNIAAILTDTGTTLPATLTTIEGKVDTVDTNVDAVLVDTGTTIPASISGLNDLSAAQVNAEMLDVLQTDTFAELASVPAATSSLKDKITFLFMLARNQVEQTATTKTLRADNTSTAVGTATVSDDGTTYTDGEFS